MKRLKSNRLSHFAYGETFPTPAQKEARRKLEEEQEHKRESMHFADYSIERVLEVLNKVINKEEGEEPCQNGE